MLAEKTLAQQTINMRLEDKADKLEQLLLSEEEIAALEKLAMPGMLESETQQRWFANCGGCGGCGGCFGCRGCFPCRGCFGCGGCRGCRGCGGCGCRVSETSSMSSVPDDIDEFGFGY
ncbi:hypothetical protein [Nostoc sp. FACHB-280]|uniref:hypothetical protein n=1 Tax=Nostoc sp. FACHB-280 TaxID=2692839 RepID=UPI00168A6FA3|nr:hypothetical protein [Nostoc sp. FACHB-280]MBD2493736.1 hypothetical protein [Nostoc sp. FACHB-280]